MKKLTDPQGKAPKSSNEESKTKAGDEDSKTQEKQEKLSFPELQGKYLVKRELGRGNKIIHFQNK